MNERQLAAALDRQRQWGVPLGRTLLELRICSTADLLAALSEQTGIPLVDLDTEPVEPEALALVSHKVAELHRVVPLRLEGARKEVLVVAIAAPAKLASLDEVQGVSRKKIHPLLALDDAIDRAIGRHYRGETAGNAPIGAAESGLPSEEAGPPYIPLEREMDLELNQQLEAAEAAADGRVWIFGWSPETSQALLKLLSSELFPAQVARAEDVIKSRPEDVVVSPLPAMEALVAGGAGFQGQLVVAVKSPEGDLIRAQSLGAKGYVATPVDKDLLLRAIKRCRRAARLA